MPNNHDRTLARILKKPELIGLHRHNLFITTEPIYYERGRVHSEPDIIAFQDGVLYNIEYKGADTRNLRAKANEQLSRQRGMLRRLGFTGKIEDIYIFGKI